MEEIVQKFAEATGLSLVSAALVIGAIGGFLLRSIFSGRSRAPEVLSMASISSAPSAMSTRAPSSIAINSVHTQQFELTSQQVAEVHDLLRKGRKIDAIKRLREITNLGLAEAKSAVEAME